MTIYDSDAIILTLGALLLIVPVAIVAIRQRAATSRAKEVLAREQDYRHLTQTSVSVQELTDQKLTEIAIQLADISARLESVERTLKEID
ncbi:hypothetical protein ACFRAR_34750 [Kitasatospora sp. NPDC056651]|uniref:hypothetical protein n=1 Tax=Kitasatospora sp. NPDC056651 TaxID=3345892 RepID=UPI0036BD672F